MELFTILEIVGVVCWVIYLLLLVRENIWCWPFAIVASMITVVMFYHSKIYLEAVLNIYYVAAACYGWHYWATARKSTRGPTDKENTPVVLWSWQLHIVTFVVAASIAYGLGVLMSQHTDSPRPYLDASLATFSFLATLMETRKVLTCWVYWFVVNICLVGLQIDREIYVYAGLSAFFVVMSVPGFIRWRKSYLVQKQYDTVRKG